jgi:type IV secretory pathway VirB6-like protein
MLGKVVAYYTKFLKNIKNEFLVMIWNYYHFLKHSIKVTKYLHTFKFSYLFKMINKKTCHVLGQL